MHNLFCNIVLLICRVITEEREVTDMVPVVEYMDVPRIEQVPRVIIEEVEEVIRVPVVREVPVTRMVEIPTGKYVKILFYFHTLSSSPFSFISCHHIVLSFFSFRRSCFLASPLAIRPVFSGPVTGTLKFISSIPISEIGIDVPLSPELPSTHYLQAPCGIFYTRV